jgi:hypothetical protein
MERDAQREGATLDRFGDMQAETSTIFVKLLRLKLEL